MRTGVFAPIEAAARIIVHEKPSFVNHLKTETLGDYGAVVSLSCDAIGVPSPNVTWYRNTKEVVEETGR